MGSGQVVPNFCVAQLHACDSVKINVKDTIFFTTVNMICYNWNNVTLT